MRYSINEKYNCVVITLKGNVMGGPDASKFNEELKELISKKKLNVVVNLSKVKFMNSSGLGIMIQGLTSMRNAGGDMKLCGATDRVQSLLMVTKLVSVFDNYRTEEEAINAYSTA